METPRTYDQIFNFRDYGGYPAEGGRLVTGALFRSGHHHSATPADLDLFARSNIATIIDLRGDSERVSTPCRRHPDFTAEVLFVPGETAEDDGPRGDPEDQASRDAWMSRIYRRLPFAPALVGTYRLFFDALIDRPGASMVHCFAGKDRTGIAVALVHHLTGVHRDDMMADYMRSADRALIDRRIAVELEAIHEWYGPISEDAMRRVFSVEPHYLETAFAEIVARHGSIEGYADAVLGVTPARREALRARVIV